MKLILHKIYDGYLFFQFKMWIKYQGRVDFDNLYTQIFLISYYNIIWCMILYIYVSQTLLLMAFLLLQPVHYETTMALLLCSASPLIAHYFALTGSWLSTAFFILSLLLTAGMATLNLVHSA